MKDIRSYIEENKEELYRILFDLCAIPAPSHHEEKRAEYCKKWFEDIGACGVYIDEALNVVFPYNCDGAKDITVIEAHTDTVFPDMEPMPYVDDGKIISCPGVGDDTACVAVMMLTAKYFIENDIKTDKGILFVANSCEEGLGNLKGTREIFKNYKGKINRLVTYDCHLEYIYDTCVGSHRYEVTVRTEGGHSFSRFGNNNAIHRLSEIISKIYTIEVPRVGDSVTTYNVGIISGGTSVNTIAENASMLCEYRSTNAECLAVMKANFEKIFTDAVTDKISVDVKLVGERPCADGLDEERQANFRDGVASVISSVINKPINFRCASTDCNIPLSLGVPAICIGVYAGGGAHTRAEWIERDSIIPGLEIGIKTTLNILENNY